MEPQVTKKQRELELRRTLDVWDSNHVVLHEEWHSSSCVTLWVLDGRDRPVNLRFNLSLDCRWSMIPVFGP